jgi:hypothetical protein
MEKKTTCFYSTASDPATEVQGSYTATQQDQAIGTVLVRVVIKVESRASC